MKATDFSLDVFNLDGKVAIITGASKGLGQAFALALSKAGAHVFVVTHNNDWEETKALLDQAKGTAHFYQADLSNRKEITAVVDECVRVFGTVDILVNNAGTIARSPLLESTEEAWDKVMAVNLDAVYFLSQEAAKVMAIQKSGKIINVASLLSFQGGKFVPAYTASKHAVAGLTKAFANELSEHSIQTNAIAPGYVKTANTAAIRADEQRNAEILSRIPSGRWAEPVDLMGTVVFLASGASNYVNGHVLAVDGGWLAR
ncbi:2-dehydro-3-deoxy-D-gluconate 5-dehydrogenase KduD [Aureibacillus halotolerans]|uniref:2-deoxy-D-gluconate 3-dehydrogenase n=1 Tax=Aureibacillus halotolerans TaxID=1508390 RepID=A0A4R6U8P6_9BACI|nr:2-dehydro-3-deoxy-D-gluconate 5-dehydrogenase KduD [Aureibacillus halotolerans]TDQ42938.1 2-deoxy-D-gluconate 3-dehydrogenase [Aureibacillus halotolerans]